MTAAFHTASEDVITRKIELAGSLSRSDSLSVCVETDYEVNRCVVWVEAHNFKRVALQFPDRLLHDSVKVTGLLTSACSGTSFYVLGDTSYGSCCVDEVAAEHCSSDAIIHYGSACLSPTRRLPVLYVFGIGSVDTEACTSACKELLPTDSSILLILDVAYDHAKERISSSLRSHFSRVLMSSLKLPSNSIPSTRTSTRDADTTSTGNEEAIQSNTSDSSAGGPDPSSCEKHSGEDQETVILGRSVSFPADWSPSYSVLFIGPEGVALSNFILRFGSKVPVYSYDPAEKRARHESPAVNKSLMKRFFAIQKVKDANIVGIVVSTLGVAGYLDVIERLREVLSKAGKKSYTFSVGKINPAKLGNFMEVDAFVVVACPQTSLLSDAAEYYKPLVTPYEVELACHPDRVWGQENYTMDFSSLLPGGDAHCEIPDNFPVTHEVSLVSAGRVTRVGTEEEEEGLGGGRGDGGAMSLRGEMPVGTFSASDGGEFLGQRSWQGLEQKLGQTEVSIATEGMKGISIGYLKEPVDKSDSSKDE